MVEIICEVSYYQLMSVLQFAKHIVELSVEALVNSDDAILSKRSFAGE